MTVRDSDKRLDNALQTTVILTQDLSDKLRLEACMTRKSQSVIIRSLLAAHFSEGQEPILKLAQK